MSFYDFAHIKPKMDLGFSKVLIFGDHAFYVRTKDFWKVKGIRFFRSRKASEIKRMCVKRVHVIDLVHGSFVLLDPGALNLIAEKGKVAGVELATLLRVRGFERALLLRKLRLAIRVLLKRRARILLYSGARNQLEFRDPEMLSSLGTLLGLTKDQALWSISKIPEFLLEHSFE